MVAISCMNPASLLLCFTVKDPFTISTNQHPNSTASDMLTLSCDMLEFVFFFSLMDTTQSSCLILDYKFPTAPIHGSIHEGRLLGTTRRQRERRLKSVFALFQSLSQLLPPTYFVKCSRTLQELNSKGPFYGGGQVGAPITQTSVKFATLCSNIFALFPAMAINIRLLCFIDRWSVLFYYRNCYVAVVKLSFVVPLGSCVLFFMCKHFKSQPHFIYILLLLPRFFIFRVWPG